MTREELTRPGAPSATRVVGGRYQLTEQIGHGGMGVVWRATDTVLRREVAVKEIRLPPGITNDERAALRRRVFREARAAARISHPSVVTVYDVIEEDGHPFIVMELIDAPTLADVVRAEGPLPPARVAAIGLDILSALEVAHAGGVVHRDIKPSNVMVPARGHCELADFGIASVQDDPGVTSTGIVLGSPAYMAPEQGSRGVTSPASDFWSMGATLFFAVEGAPPFEGEGALPMLAAVMNEAPRGMRRAGPLEPVIAWLLDKDPDRRPAPAVVRAELDRIVAQGEPSAVVEPYPNAPHADDTLQLVRTDAVPPPVVAPPPARRPATSYGRGPGRASLVAMLVLVGVLITAAVYGISTLGRSKNGTTAKPPATAPSVSAAAISRAAKASSAPVASASKSSAPAVPPASKPTASTSSSAATSAAAQATSAPASSPAPATPTPASSPTVAASAGPSTPSTTGVPADWVPFTNPAIGYTVLHPPGWTVTQKGLNTDIKNPATGAYMRVAHTTQPGPDPTQDWIDFEPDFARRHPGYQRIALYPTTYQGMKAGYWEYSYGGQRAIDLGFITPDGKYGFALNFQTPRSLWTASKPTFEAFKAAFTPPVG